MREDYNKWLKERDKSFELTVEEPMAEIESEEIFYTSARCTCPSCKNVTMISSKEINEGLIQCFHCDILITINKENE